jgi:hypothetical protein
MLKRAIGRAKRDRALEHFSVESMVTRYDKVYRELL